MGFGTGGWADPGADLLVPAQVAPRRPCSAAQTNEISLLRNASGPTRAPAGDQGSLDMSNVAANESGPIAGVRNPTIKQTKLELDTIVELGKPAVVASIDDPLTARKLQVEATITRAN